jgi:hypothetical protein
MQHEFINRIAAQRAVLRFVNGRQQDSEQLHGLSSKAIDRWVSVNRLDPDSRLVELLKDVSGKLFFLANRSQEHISDTRKTLFAEIVEASDLIRKELDPPLNLSSA